jgi:pantetheine-phosphate adenylyltransferase
MKAAMYPGTFDPITSGHVDVAARAAHLFDRVIVAVAPGRPQNPGFDLTQRLEPASRALGHLGNVEVEASEGLGDVSSTGIRELMIYDRSDRTLEAS